MSQYDPLKIFIEADVQTADNSVEDNPSWSLPATPPAIQSPDEYRRYSVGLRNHQRAVDQANTDLPDVFICDGDMVDFNTANNQIQLQAESVDLISDDLTMPILYQAGNHDIDNYNGGVGGDKPLPVDFYTDFDSQATMLGEVADGDGWKSYYYEVKGVRIVMLNTLEGDISGTVHETFLGTALDTPMPCIVVGHYPMYETVYASWTYMDDFATLQGIMEAAGNVQCVLNGHYHWDDLDQTINDIPYISLFGQVLCPEEDDSAYYLLEVIPNAVRTANGDKPNIRITGYGSNGVAKTKGYTKYLVA